MARIILLNGTSSAGKSALACAVQELAPRTFLHVAMDTFIGMLPIGTETRSEWFPVRVIRDGPEPAAQIGAGASGTRLLAAMRAFIGAAADAGLDLIIDDVCGGGEIEDYRRRLAGHDLAVVRVCARPDILAERERRRGDRIIGTAREQAGRIHQGVSYDHSIDTSDVSAMEAARALLGAIG